MKVLLFDADGVLTLPEEFFTQVYARSRGLKPEPFELFFKNSWQDIVTGQKDLKQSITESPDLWQWDGSVDELVDYWCKTEDIRNEEMLNLIQQLKQKGIPRYLATDQEKYRGEYMRSVMFPELFEKYYISSELGYTKTDPEFFEFVIKDLETIHPGLEVGDIVFFDDSQSKVDTAMTCGLDARLYTGIEQVEKLYKENS